MSKNNKKNKRQSSHRYIARLYGERTLAEYSSLIDRGYSHPRALDMALTDLLIRDPGRAFRYRSSTD